MTPDANDLCVFAIKRGNIESRIDPHFYLPVFQEITKRIKNNPYVRLGDIAVFSSETTDFSEFKNGSFDYLEISGIMLGVNEYRTTKTDIAMAPSRAKMKTIVNDIVISLTRPHRGAIAIIRDNNIIASTGFSVIRTIKDGFDKKWLLFTLLCSISLQQMLQRSSGGNYPAIIEEELKRIYIPLIDYNTQRKMVEKIENSLQSIKAKEQKANFYLSHNSLLALEKLNIYFENKQQPLTYATRQNWIDGRIDADFCSPIFVRFREQIENSVHGAVTIGDITDRITTGFAAGKQDQADDLPEEQRIPHLRPFSITPEGELSFETKKYVPKANLKPEDYCVKNEILFNNTNSPELVGKTTVFDSDVLCAASNHMTRITVKDGVNPYYVAAFFNVLLSIGYWKLLCTNFNNQAGVNTETLKKVKIPLPPKDVQDQIANEIMQRRAQANELRKQAVKEWADAKAQFEKELLGEG